MTPTEQLLKWIDGESIHNDERDECCPDFSCCTPGSLAPPENRRQFATAYLKDDHETVYRMLGQFLGGELAGESVYVAGAQE